jgi:DNA-binding PadR family transcriptional regulator
MSKDYQQLPKVAFSILLALSLKERHGYEIIQQIEEDSCGKIKIGPGALYTSIRHLHDKGLIAEISGLGASSRRYYKMTGAGSKILEAELEYYQNAIALAKSRHILSQA